MRDIKPGDEVVVLGTGEHGVVMSVGEQDACVAIENDPEIEIDLEDLALAGEEAP